MVLLGFGKHSSVTLENVDFQRNVADNAGKIMEEYNH